MKLNASALASALGFPADALRADALVMQRPFRLRRRGVETKLMLGEPARPLDYALIRNVARAQEWLAAIQRGLTFEQVAVAGGCSKNRILQMVHLAFLAPDIVSDILRGAQPIGLTSEWLKTHDLPACWQAQRCLIAAL